MYKQLSRNKHHHEQSVDDFMKQIRKYNLKSERYLSPKPLLYMYSNPRNHTLHTIEREKSKTLSNRQSQSKKTTKNVRQKVQSILSIGKHKKMKSSQSFSKSNGKSKLNSQKNQRKFSTINDDQSQDSPMKNRYKIKSKISKKSTQSNADPGDLIEEYSRKLRKAQKYLQSKSKLGKMLCDKFLQMLNEIVDSMVKKLHSSFAELQKSIEERVIKQMDIKYKRVLNHSQQNYSKLQKKFQKLTKRHMQILDKENFNNQLIYNFRKQNVDIDHIFGKTFLGTDKLGGRGYHKDVLDDQQLNKSSNSSKQIFQFIAHPQKSVNKNISKQPEQVKKNQPYPSNVDTNVKVKSTYISKSNKKQNPLLKNIHYMQQQSDQQQKYDKSQQKRLQFQNQFDFIEIDREDEQIVKIQSSQSSKSEMMFEDRIKPYVKNNRIKKQKAFVDRVIQEKAHGKNIVISQKNNEKIKTIKKNQTIQSRQRQKNQSF